MSKKHVELRERNLGELEGRLKDGSDVTLNEGFGAAYQPLFKMKEVLTEELTKYAFATWGRGINFEKDYMPFACHTTKRVGYYICSLLVYARTFYKTCPLLKERTFNLFDFSAFQAQENSASASLKELRLSFRIPRY